MEKISALSPPLTRTEPSLTLQQPERSDFTEQDPGCSAHTDSSTRTPNCDSNIKIRHSSDCTRDDSGMNTILYHKCPCMCLFTEHGSGDEALILLTTRKSLIKTHFLSSLKMITVKKSCHIDPCHHIDDNQPLNVSFLLPPLI